ncbi:MAG: RDD family protein [Clostridia bacterium]|nr:RDD family protein [Clostridia bacterium]
MLHKEERLQKADFKRRLVAFLIDHVILSLILVFGFFFYAGDSITEAPEKMFSLFPMFMFVVFFAYCLKDIFGGASIGKRIMGLVVRCNDNSELKPSPLKLFCRNIFSFLWPIELFMIRRSKRKLGDNLSGTDVYYISRKTSRARIVAVGVVLFVFFVSSVVLGVTMIIKNDASYQTAISYIEASEEIRNTVGEITGYGFWVQGSLNTSPHGGNARYVIQVKGEDGDLPVAIWLERSRGTDWQIVNTSY